MKAVIRHLRRAALLQAGDSLTDGQLLESFLTGRDEAAFEVLLRRHGPMVLGVCRRVLGNADDADDAFQATFLVLVRKAATVRPRETVGSWLYGVAYRTAQKARVMNAKRRTKENQARERRPPPRPARGDPVLAAGPGEATAGAATGAARRGAFGRCPGCLVVPGDLVRAPVAVPANRDGQGRGAGRGGPGVDGRGGLGEGARVKGRGDENPAVEENPKFFG